MGRGNTRKGSTGEGQYLEGQYWGRAVLGRGSTGKGQYWEGAVLGRSSIRKGQYWEWALQNNTIKIYEISNCYLPENENEGLYHLILHWKFINGSKIFNFISYAFYYVYVT